jgi:hypothetical protein
VLNVVTPFLSCHGNARQSLVYFGQIVEALITRYNGLQGPITSISVGLSAMEARHRPGGDGKVVDDRDDDNAPGILAIRAGAKFGDNQPLDIVLGLREFFHNPHNNRLGPPGKITAWSLCGVTEGETQWRIAARGNRRCFRTGPAKLPIGPPL